MSIHYRPPYTRATSCGEMAHRQDVEAPDYRVRCAICKDCSEYQEALLEFEIGFDCDLSIWLDFHKSKNKDKPLHRF